MDLKTEAIRTHEVRNRTLLTLLVIALYLCGRSLLLYGIDPQSIEAASTGAQDVLLALISGDRYRYSVMALGIMPYITVSMLVTFAMMLRSSEARARVSPVRVERLTYGLTMAVSLVLAVMRAEELHFLDVGMDPLLLKALTVVQLLAGSVAILLLSALNRRHGFGAQVPIILVNVVDSLLTTLRGHDFTQLRLILAVCLVVAAVTAVMESVLVRIPVQRVSIHNSYADKSYIAYKLNPIGTMPVMFATAFFMLPQLVIRLLLWGFPNHEGLRAVQAQLVLTEPMGVYTYLIIVLLLTILGSFLMLGPGEAAEQLQKGGDSIVGVYAGRATKRYLRWRLLCLSFFSGLLMSGCMAVSLLLALSGRIPAELAMLPSMAMILVGVVASLVQEISAYLKFDSYKTIVWE